MKIGWVMPKKVNCHTQSKSVKEKRKDLRCIYRAPMELKKRFHQNHLIFFVLTGIDDSFNGLVTVTVRVTGFLCIFRKYGYFGIFLKYHKLSIAPSFTVAKPLKVSSIPVKTRKMRPF